MRYVTRIKEEQWSALIDELRCAKGQRYAQLRGLAERNMMPHLLDWGQRFFPHYFTVAPSKMHLELVHDLQWYHANRNIKSAVIAPRGGAKTTWVSKIYPLFCICHNLEKYILLIADSSEQACENLEAIRHELDENDMLAEAYPGICGAGPKWNQTQIITRNGIKVHAAGTGKRIRGRGHRASRPTLIIVDDLENDTAVLSGEQREKTMRWLERALIPAGSPSTNMLFVGTALHPEDALQQIRRRAGWRSKSYAALIREPTRQDLWDKWRYVFRDISIPPDEREEQCRQIYQDNRNAMDEGAELLWPERESLYDLMCWRETNGEIAFQAEKQGNAAATGATEFGSELFASSIWFDVWPEMTLTAMALDPSKGSNERNDFSAFVWGGIGRDGNIYVDADLQRRDASQVVVDGLRIYREFQPQSFGLETVMFLQLFANLFDMEARRQGILLPITQIHPHESKLIRIRQLTPYLKSGRIRFRAGSRGAEELVSQLKVFPTGRHDDGPDALHMMIELLRVASIGSFSDSAVEQLVT